jgi:crotonobetainyl-CoA:carnitine CoA-transferase CaiB-like acyl-CoA transferase
MVNAVPRFARDPTQMRCAAGAVGEDNLEVYQSWFGLSGDEIEQLKSRKVI